MLAVAPAVALAQPSLSGGAPATSEGLAAVFDPAEGGTPLDLFGVRFGQTASTDLTLIIRTHGPWETSAINPRFGRTLCLTLRSDEQALPAGRLCMYPNFTAKSGLALRYTVLDPTTGVQLGIRDLSPVVSRPSKTSVRVTFTPALLRLKPGLYHWVARSEYRDDAKCPPPAGCEDLLPNSGEAETQITLSVSPEARQRCFGAASRDPLRRCVNHRLRTAIVPPPEDAIFSQNSPCTPLSFEGVLGPCEFGVPAGSERATIALVGDSHASHWRAALEYVAQRKRWRGVSITRSGCPLMRATTKLPANRQAECLQWNDQVPKWFAKHPEIHTVFVVSHFAGDVVIPTGSDELDTKVAGFQAAWKALPASVKRIVVIRDTPLVGFQANECVRQAKAKKRNAGSVCAVKRSEALRQDPSVVAARRLKSPRVKVIDMSRFLCSAKRCFPVIGGALVYKDDQHMTDVFATTLGPFLGRAIDKVL
jgi:hypothetical protein